MDIGWLDWTLWVVLAFSVALGALRGLVREVISLAAWVLATGVLAFFAGMRPSKNVREGTG